MKPGQEWILYAVAKGHEDWQEQLITETKDAAHLAKAKAWATANGFDRLRVAIFTPGEKPDFVATIARGQR